MSRRANQYLLARLLRSKADILEIPVQFFPISPERVKRTSVIEGLQSLGALMAGRLRSPDVANRGAGPTAPQSVAPADDERRTDPVTSR